MVQTVLIMDDISVLLLSILYGLFGIFLISRFIRSIKAPESKIHFHICFAMYILIYSIIPCLVHFHVFEVGTAEWHYYTLDYDDRHIGLFFLSFLFAIVGYVGFTKGYSMNVQVYSIRNYQEYSSKVWFLTAAICLMIGIACLHIWTQVFGGPLGILTYASSLRSGYDIGINNPYTVFKRFVPLVQFANVVYFSLWLKKRNTFYLLFAIIAFLYSILYLLANDGRAPLVMHIVALLWAYLSLRRTNSIGFTRSNVVKICLTGTIAMFCIHNADRIASDNWNKERVVEDEYSFDLLSSVREEFSFTVRNNQAIFTYLSENPATFRFPLEVYSGVLGILPSSFRPEWLEKLEIVNTRSWSSNRPQEVYTGGRPPDLIVTGIYTLNVFGIFILPFLLGWLLKKLDVKRNRIVSVFDNTVYYSLVLYPVMRIVAYCDFDGLMLNFFYIFLGYIILRFVNKIV